ncbi:MAG: hypothetical protein CMJ18_28090 [Phycisphaeraceae bacterium]|nr:hypothetical protein [Phycisphaeraceae bacterium]
MPTRPKLRRFRPPIRLLDQPRAWRVIEEAGDYRLTLRCDHPRRFGRAVFVLLDDREVGYLRLPNLPDVASIDLTCTFHVGQAPAALSFAAERLPSSLGRGAVHLQAAALSRIVPEPVTGWPRTARPDAPLLTVWGYGFGTYYQRTDDGLGPEALFDRMVAPYRRLGANAFAHLIYKKMYFKRPVHGYGAGMAYPIEWTDGSRGPERGHHDDPRWIDGGFRHHARLDFDHGVMVWPHAVFPTPGRKDRHGQIRDLLDHLSDALDLDANELYHGFASEFYFTKLSDVKRMTRMIEQTCPGAFVADHHLRPSERGPNFLTAGQTAHGYGTVARFGCDDHDPMRGPLADGADWYEPPLYGMFARTPAARLRDEWGDQFVITELDCRDWVPPPANYGGDAHEDWVIKQVHDLVRPDAGTPQRHVAAVSWSCGGNRTSKSNLFIAAAACNDPIRGAFAAQLRSTGADGTFDAKRRGASSARFEEAAARPRDARPSDTFFLQNNHLRVYARPGAATAELCWDPEASAHFDGNALARRLAAPFLRLDPTWSWRVRELGPVVAELEACDHKDRQQLRLTMHADSPYVIVRSRGATTIGAGAGQRLRRRDGVGLLRDPARRLPDRFLFDIGATKLHPTFKDDRVLLAPRGSGTWTLVWGVSDRLKPTTPQALRTALRTGTRSGPSTCRLVRPVDLVSRVRGPVWVRRGPWWHRQALQPSLTRPNRGWVKTYEDPRWNVEVGDDGLLCGAIEPGPGSDYVLAFRNPSPSPEGFSGTVAVLASNPVATPYVRLADRVERAWIGAKPWQRFHDQLLWLPKTPGDYRLRVTYGDGSVPTLTRSTADFEQCAWDAESWSLLLKPALPPWCKRLPTWYRFTALIEHEGWRMRRIDGGRCVRGNERRSIVEFGMGVVRLESEPLG